MDIVAIRNKTILKIFVTALFLLILGCSNTNQNEQDPPKENDLIGLNSTPLNGENLVGNDSNNIEQNIVTENGPETPNSDAISQANEGSNPAASEVESPAKEQPENIPEIDPEPEIEPYPIETIEPAPPTQKFPDHDLWDKLLRKNVSSSGKVNYKGFKADHAALKAYLKELEKFPPAADWSRNEKMAYWINAYNAHTVDLIVRNYPLKSITDLGKPWDIPFVKAEGKTYSLSQVENSILRPRFKDARIHFAINCASVSCPKLLNRAFLPSTLSSQLNQQTRNYINDPNENTLHTDKAEISELFDWYQEDFLKNGSLIDYLNKYSNTQVNADAPLTYKTYNWNLNE